MNKYILLDLERFVRSGTLHYWKAHKRGYTTFLEEAGHYDYEQAKKLEETDIKGRTIAISLSVIDNIIT